MSSLLARRLLGLAAGTLALLAVADASAKAAPKKDDDAAEEKADKKGDDAADGKGDAKKKGDDESDKSADGDEKDEKAAAKPKSADASSPAFEQEGKDYYYLGLRYRHTLLPKFLINLFVDGGPSVVSLPAFGLEASKRRDGFEMIGSLTYQSWGMDPFPFKGKNESEYAWEIAESKLKMLNATADFLWSSKITSDNQLQFLYGLTAGISFVWGDLIHQQAHPGSGGTGDPKTFVPCTQQDSVSGQWAGNYCNPADNSRWVGYVEPSWAGGGYRPIIYPTFGLQLGLRYQPSKWFATRLDAGYNLFSGFFFGLGLDFGLPQKKS